MRSCRIPPTPLQLERLEDRAVPAAVAQPLAVGQGPGAEPVVKVLNADGSTRIIIMAYDAALTGGVHVAMGDVTGDDVADVVTGPGEGGPHIKVYDGADGTLMRSFMAYDTGPGGLIAGWYVAAGDVNHDGRADIITAPRIAGGPHVKVFSGADLTLLTEFMAYPESFRGGVSVAAADVTGDGFADIITGAGYDGGPHVKVFDGVDGSLVRSFMAYSETFVGGVRVAGGDVTGDGVADIVVGPGPWGGPHVRVFDGATGGNVVREFLNDTSTAGGVSVAAADVNGDGQVEIITGAGFGSTPTVRTYGPTAAPLVTLSVFDPGFLGGVFVG